MATRTVHHLGRTARYEINGPISIDARPVGTLYREAGFSPSTDSYTVRAPDGEIMAWADSGRSAAKQTIYYEIATADR